MKLPGGEKYILIILMSLLVFTGCGKKHVPAYPPSVSEAGLNDSKLKTNRMLVWNASLTLEVDKIDTIVQNITTLVDQNKGYIESRNMSGADDAHFRIRISSEQLSSVIDQLARLGDETNRYISSEDVNEQYIDTEARLKNAIALRDRLKDLLGKANTVKEILEVEKELTRIQSDIDSMEGILKNLKGKAEFATIDLYVKEKIILGPLGFIAKGIGWVIMKLFVIR